MKLPVVHSPTSAPNQRRLPDRASITSAIGLESTSATLGGYDLTYGGLAGVMITLIFFFIIGLGVVIGAELNAALAEVPEEALKEGEEAFYNRESI